jgi:hypothetical protein
VVPRHDRYGGALMINSKLFEAFCLCPTKCFLQSRQFQAPENAVATWFERRKELYREEVKKGSPVRPALILEACFEPKTSRPALIY